MVLAVLIHDGEALGLPAARAGRGDIDDARVEIALLAEQPFVDDIGDDMGDATPVGLAGGVGGALDLGLRQHVPQAELDAGLSASLCLGTAGDQRLRTDRLPVLEIRRVAPAGTGLDECLLRDRAEQAGPRQVVGHHGRDVLAKLGGVAAPTAEWRDGDRDRVGARAVHVDHRAPAAARRSRLRRRQRLRAHRGRSREQGSGAGSADEQRTPAERQHRQSCHVRAFLKVGIGR